MLSLQSVETLWMRWKETHTPRYVLFPLLSVLNSYLHYNPEIEEQLLIRMNSLRRGWLSERVLQRSVSHMTVSYNCGYEKLQ